MSRALICDFGGVLTSPLIEGFLRYEKETGITLEELGRAIGASTEAHGEHPLYELERGRISEREFARRLGEQLAVEFDHEQLRNSYFAGLEPNRPMIDLVAELRGDGVRTALLTNNVREWEPLWRAKLPEIDDVFEVVVDSAFVGMRKPEPEIYELTVQRLGGIEPAGCVFVDDIEVNCDAARELGMTAVHFTGNEQAIPEIRRTLASRSPGPF